MEIRTWTQPFSEINLQDSELIVEGGRARFAGLSRHDSELERFP